MPEKTLPAKRINVNGETTAKEKILRAALYNVPVSANNNRKVSPAMTINVYLKPVSRPNVSSILKKYRLPWRHEVEPSFIDGAVRTFDFLGVSKPKAKLLSLRSRRNSKIRDFLKLLGNRQESGR